MVSAVSVLSAFSGWRAIDVEEDAESVRSYTEELAFVEREDGIGLEGAIIYPTTVERNEVAIIWVHGNTSRFYDLPYVQVGREMAALGYTFITANTHRHDDISTLWDDKGTTCWERFEEAPLDIEPWIELAINTGAQKVVVVGHSFGATKVAYYQAIKQDPRVLGIVCASADVKWHVDAAMVSLAERMETEGRADEVLPQLEAAWYRMSVQTLLSRARVAQHVLSSDSQTPYIARIECPILAFYGTEEDWCGTQVDLDNIRRHATGSARVDTCLLEGADHIYWGKSAQTAGLISGWVDGLTTNNQ
ncbi:MAG TPA: alpha/beta fold hydrolase [Chloroflexia bacterium]|nr:alpha/beta fold hydrolase [Chloroflexia bacterium]